MNGTQDLIDQVLTQHHGINTTKTAAASYAPARLRILRNAQKALRSFWNLRDWTFRYVAGIPMTIPNGTSEADLPADWANEGREGSVALADGTQLVWRPVRTVRQYQRDNMGTTGIPTYYSVDLMRKIIVDIPVAGDTELTLEYQQATPTLTDANPGNLDLMPAEWHDLVYESTVVRELNDKGDQGRLAVQAELVKNMVFDACVTEQQGKPFAQDMPRYPGSADVFLPDDL